MLGTYWLLLGRHLYRATYAVTRGLGFGGFIRPNLSSINQGVLSTALHNYVKTGSDLKTTMTKLRNIL